MTNDLVGENRAISDIYLVSALMAYGLRPLRIDRTQPKRQKFIFDSKAPINVLTYSEREPSMPLKQTLCLDAIETHFLAKTLLFPGNYHEMLKEIRASIHGFNEDKDKSNGY